MGKHRHTKDKMHITYAELRDDWAGLKAAKSLPFSKLPFYCCALSLAPFESAVCTPQGHTFDILYIIPFIRKYHRCPITGRPLKSSELIQMHWHKNEDGKYQDPISYKVFTDSTHIVCIRTSGNVYAYDTITQLNKKQHFWYDLVSNEPFTKQDVITIQDPRSSGKDMATFDYLKNSLPFIPPEKLQPSIQENETIERIMEEQGLKRKANESLRAQENERKKKIKSDLQHREDVQGFIKWCMSNKVYRHERETDSASFSLTSTNYTPAAKASTVFRQLKEGEIRDKIYKIVVSKKLKGEAIMATNLGNFRLLIHADLVPKTSENFIQLCEKEYYDGIKFHRLVKDFCLQGGDPTGTGAGGESVFGKPFEDQFHTKLSHKKAGILSMANAGPMTNGSQFFITLADATALDGKHSVFGEIVSQNSMAILYEINKNYTSKSNKPKHDIIIEKIQVMENPFRKAIASLRAALESETKEAKEDKAEQQKARWIHDETEAFKIPEQKKEQKGEADGSQAKLKKLLHDYCFT